MTEFASFSLNQAVRKNILELVPYRCARDVSYIFLILIITVYQDYSEGILLDANENSFGPAVDTHHHLSLNRLVLLNSDFEFIL